MTGRLSRLALVLALLMATMTAAGAQDAAGFYAGRTIAIVMGTSPGGSYDIYGRVFATHLPRHIPGTPNIVVEHMPGAGGAVGANYFYNVAAKDGSVIATLSAGIVSFAVLNPDKVKFDPARFTWLSAWGEAVSTLAVMNTAPIKTLEEAKTKEVVLGSIGTGTISYQIPALMNSLLGTRFKVITGYAGGNPIRLAMERGEVSGTAILWEGWKSGTPDWVRDGKLVQLVQVASKRLEPDLADVPTLIELAKTDEQRHVFAFLSHGAVNARAVSLPPGVPADRVAAMRAAVDRTYKDAAFLADAAKADFHIAPVSAEATTDTVKQQAALPAQLVARVRNILGYDSGTK